MCCIPQRLGQMDICKGVVSLATAAGAIYLLYKAIRAGIKCQPPLCSASPICVARECPRPGERARPQEEHSIKVLELISTIWDSELHIAGLRLLNNLPLPDFAHPQLRRVMPALMEILQSDYILAQVQAAQLLSNLVQKNDLLYDILNCQVRKELKDGLMDVSSDIVKGRIVDSSDRLSPHRIILFLFLPLH
ncbi:Armadillo repeat-containing protein 12, partial [Eschrichtius robustus]|nr:Armadillo repeat-containing protein 12 [Eschrichtius robustus]